MKPKPGEVYLGIENPRGELGFYLVADGGVTPYRLKIHGPAFSNLAILPIISKGVLLADLVAIRGNPVDRIDDISNVVCTVRAGRRFEPSALLRAVQNTFDQPPDGAITQDLLDYTGGDR